MVTTSTDWTDRIAGWPAELCYRSCTIINKSKEPTLTPLYSRDSDSGRKGLVEAILSERQRETCAVQLLSCNGTLIVTRSTCLKGRSSKKLVI